MEEREKIKRRIFGIKKKTKKIPGEKEKSKKGRGERGIKESEE